MDVLCLHKFEINFDMGSNFRQKLSRSLLHRRTHTRARTHTLSLSFSLLYFQHQPVIEGDKFLSECNPVQKNFFIWGNRTRKLKPASKIFLIGKLFGVTWYFHFLRIHFFSELETPRGSFRRGSIGRLSNSST